MKLEKGSEWHKIYLTGATLFAIFGLINIIVEPGIKAVAYFLFGCGAIFFVLGTAETTKNRYTFFMIIAIIVSSCSIILMFYSYILGGELHFALWNLLLIVTFAAVILVYRLLVKKKSPEIKPGD